MNINFKAKYIVNFDTRCLTGLHIGGGDSGAGIGDIDNPVIKDPVTQLPVIAGSSLKGRLRERLEWLHADKIDGKNAISRKIDQLIQNRKEGDKKIDFSKVAACNCGRCDICRYFGHSAREEDVVLAPTRFIFRDAFPKQNNGYNQVQIWQEKLGKNIFTEQKFENTISRLTAEANPRQLERVPAGSIFRGEIVIDLYDIEGDNIQTALTLLFQGLAAIEQSYLGGAGSRGSGRVEFNNFEIVNYLAEYYIDPEAEPEKLPINPGLNAQAIFESKAFATN